MEPRRRPFLFLSIIVGLAAFALVAAGCGSANKEQPVPKDFRIGLEAPLTGDQSRLGKGMLDGALLAAQKINKGGGVLGRDVVIVPIDDAADPQTGVDAAHAAVASGLNGVVGPYNSGVGLKTLPIYIDAGLVPMRLTSDDRTSGMGFTLQPMTSQIAPVAVTAITRWRKAKTVAIVYDSTQAYTLAAAAAVRDGLRRAGVKVVAYMPIKPGASTYLGAVKRLAKTGADLIYSATYYPEGGRIARAIDELGVKSECLADYGSYDTGFITTAGVAAARACPVVGVPAPGDFPDSAALIESYHNKFGGTPNVWSPYTYDSVDLLVDAARASGGFGASDLKTYLGGVRDWKGWTGTVTIDPKTGNRDPATVVVVATTPKATFHVDSDWAKAVGAPY